MLLPRGLMLESRGLRLRLMLGLRLMLLPRGLMLLPRGGDRGLR